MMRSLQFILVLLVAPSAFANIPRGYDPAGNH
jgi:hypothetical protein